MGKQNDAERMEAIADHWRAALWCCALMLLNRDISSPVKVQGRRVYCAPKRNMGFTLIELAIVLVVIGLIIGGVLVGGDLIKAAEVRATITQIEKYQTAVNTFRDKYNALPGDIPDPAATNFGFAPRHPFPGEGDGNGIIQGSCSDGCYGGTEPATGEAGMVWVDLSKANLIEGTFNTATSQCCTIPGSNINLFLPQAKLGKGNYIYVWSGGVNASANSGAGDSQNYFGISSVTNIGASQDWEMHSIAGLTVLQASLIDKKVDDGFPQTGRVLALYLNYDLNTNNPAWAAGGGVAGISDTSATPGSSATCYDNSNAATGTPGISGAAQHYSIEMSNGSNVNCALSFRLQ